MGAVTLEFSPSSYYFIFYSILLFAIYLATLYFSKEISKQDLIYVRQMLTRQKKDELSQAEFSQN